MSPSIHRYDEALAVVRSERGTPLEKEGPLPPPALTDFRYVEAWHYSEKQILESSESWLQDMYACHRWRQWVESDEFERMRKSGTKKRHVSDGEIAAMRAENPRLAGIPDEALRHRFGEKQRR